MRPRLALVSAALAVGVSCASIETRPDQWWDQLEARSPCFDVDLIDGLDESSTDEVRALFDCLDQGQLSPLRHSADQLEVHTRAGDPVGVEVARAVNALPDAGADPWALAGIALDALRAEGRPLDLGLDLLLEWSYAAPAAAVRDGEIPLTSGASLGDGMLPTSAPVWPSVAAALLDDDLHAATWAGEVVSDPETKRWLRTAGAWAESTHPDVAGPVDGLLPHLGQLVLDTRTPGNDRWSGASGDSLRDLVEVAVLGPEPVLEAVGPGLAEALGDPWVRGNLEVDLVEWQQTGRLHRVPAQLAWLAEVDIDGDSLSSGELSGLYRLLRLLHDTNQPMHCTWDLWVTELEIDLGNVAVSMLSTIADWQPGSVQTGVGILGEVVGWGLSEWILYEIADSGTCPALTPQVVSDLPAMDLFYEDETYDLLVVLVGALKDLKWGQEDRLPGLVDVVSGTYAGGAAHPTEELFRDIADTPLLDDAIDLLPVLSEPQDYGISAGDQSAADLQDVVDLLLWVVEEGEDGTGWDTLRPLAVAVAEEDATWRALAAQAELLTDSRTRSSSALDILPELLALDPELVVLDSLGPVLREPRVAEPLLRVLERPEVSEALLASGPKGDDPEVPLAFTARLVVDGTLDTMLEMVDLVIGTLEDLT